jgi:hypothetical protein
MAQYIPKSNQGHKHVKICGLLQIIFFELPSGYIRELSYYIRVVLPSNAIGLVPVSFHELFHFVPDTVDTT